MIALLPIIVVLIVIAVRYVLREEEKPMLLPDDTAICPKCFGMMFHKEWNYVCKRCGYKIKEEDCK